MRPARALALLVLVAACAGPVAPPTPSAPPAPDPRDEVRAVETVGRTGDVVLGLTQGRVRACSGSYAPPTMPGAIRATELACTGGVTGSATIRPGRDGGRLVEWSLDTGESGTVRL